MQAVCLQLEMLSLLCGYLANFVRPSVIVSAADITSIDFTDRENQLESLSIGTETFLLISNEEDDFVGTALESLFYESVRLFYVTVVAKMLAKFPFNSLSPNYAN